MSDTPMIPAPATPAEDQRTRARIHLMQLVASAKPKTPDRSFRFKEPLQRGWLIPWLLRGDDLLWGRWSHWFDTMTAGTVIPGATIPQIPFGDTIPQQGARRWMEAALNAIPTHGEWRGWSGSRYLEYFLRWLLFAFGDNQQPEEPEPPAQGSSERLYQVFCLEALQVHPYDYLGDIMAEAEYGRSAGFFPTPMSLTELSVRMVYGMDDGRDHRTEKVMDPCVGTGRFLLSASNFSYRLYGQDIMQIMCLATTVNGWLYAPWLVKSFPFFAESDRREAEQARQAKLATIPPMLRMEQLELPFA